MNDETLRSIWDAAVVGDPANGVAPTFDKQAQSEARTQINTARVKDGLPSIQNTVAAWQQAEQQAAPYRQGVAESQFIESPEEVAVRKEEEDFQRMSNAAKAFDEQVRKPNIAQRESAASRAVNVVDAAEAALEGGEQGIQAFVQQIQAISDPRLARETVEIAQRAGVQFSEPLVIVDAQGVQSFIPINEPTRGGFAVLPDGTYRVDLADGTTTTAVSEDAARAMIAGQKPVQGVGTGREARPGSGLTKAEDFRALVRGSAAQFAQGEAEVAEVDDVGLIQLGKEQAEFSAGKAKEVLQSDADLMSFFGAGDAPAAPTAPPSPELQQTLDEDSAFSEAISEAARRGEDASLIKRGQFTKPKPRRGEQQNLGASGISSFL
jgi:hypothetical protein